MQAEARLRERDCKGAFLVRIDSQGKHAISVMCVQHSAARLVALLGRLAWYWPPPQACSSLVGLFGLV